MITEQDLQAAIAECEGVRNPNANTCIKLAAFYTIREHLFPQKFESVLNAPTYSMADMPSVLESGTEFAEAVNRMRIEEVMSVMDELMSTIRVLQPRLYEGVMRKLFEE